MPVAAANHFSFTVSNAARTARYLQDVLGLELLSIGPREAAAIRAVTSVPDADILIAYLQASNIRVELVQYVSPATKETLRPRPCDLGFAHMAFDVPHFDDVVSRAAQYGAHPIGATATIDRGPNRGCRVTYLRDQDGVTIELVDQTPALEVTE